MTRVRDKGAAAAYTLIPADVEISLVSQPTIPVDTVERHRWLRGQARISDRNLAVEALAVLQDSSEAATMLHTKAVGVLLRTAKPAIEAAVARLARRKGTAIPTVEDAIVHVHDVVTEAIAKTTARSGGEWVTYVAMRINGQITNYLIRDVPKLQRQVQLIDVGHEGAPLQEAYEACESPTAEAIESVILAGIAAVTTTDDQRAALESMFAVGRFRGLSTGTDTQAQAAEVSGLSQQRISVLRRRLKSYLYGSLGVPEDDEE
jgi:hypothetical protein